jgi:hypothetical protein
LLTSVAGFGVCAAVASANIAEAILNIVFRIYIPPDRGRDDYR